MDKIILNIKDKSKLTFFIELINQFDFIEILKKEKTIKKDDDYNFFLSAGLWKNKNINVKELRKQAWNRQK